MILQATVLTNLCSSVRNRDHQLSSQIDSRFAEHIEHIYKQLRTSPTLRTAMAGPAGPIREVISESAPNLEACNANRDLNALNTIDVTTEDLHMNKPNNIRIPALQTVNCCWSCPCKCHHVKPMFIPTVLRGVAGSGWAVVRGSKSGSDRCDYRSCHGHTEPCVEVQYTLPFWIAKRMIQMRIWSSPSHNPEALFNFPRVVSMWSSGFGAVRSGNINLLKMAMTNGECRPTDIDDHLGWSLSEVCTACHRLRQTVTSLKLQVVCSDVWLSRYNEISRRPRRKADAVRIGKQQVRPT